MHGPAVPCGDLPPVPLDELVERLAGAVDPENDCDACGDSLPGALVPAGNDDNHLFVQSCDACTAHCDDLVAARRAATALGWHVRLGYDDRTLRYWRPFVAKPGGWDDRDFASVDADEYGWGPAAEAPLTRVVPTPVRRALSGLRWALHS